MSIAWYPFYTGDYQKKTSHLSMLEHGAYRLLLDHYYATGQPLPNDAAKLFRICRARSPAERKSVLFVKTEFFIEIESLLENKRCSSEIQKLLNYSKTQSARAKPRLSPGIAAAQPARARLHNHSHKEEEREERKKEKTLSGKKNFLVEEVTLAMIADWADEKITAPLDVQSEIEKCAVYPFKKRKTDGIATVKNWLLKAQEFYYERNPRLQDFTDDASLSVDERMQRKLASVGIV